MRRFVLSTVFLTIVVIGAACGGGTAPETSTPTDAAPAPDDTEPPATETLPPPTDTPPPATPTELPSTPTQVPTPTDEPPTATQAPTATARAQAATVTSTPAGEAPSPTSTAAQSAGGGPDGVEIFNTMGCGTCHILDAADTSGQVGPELNGVGSRAAERIASEEYTGDATTAEGYIRESILSPNAHVVAGYPENVMPLNFGDRLSDDQLNALVEFLMQQK